MHDDPQLLVVYISQISLYYILENQLAFILNFIKTRINEQGYGYMLMFLRMKKYLWP